MTLDQSGMIELLKRAVTTAGSQKAAADALKVSPAYLNDILRGRREVSAQFAERLGFRKVVSFVSERVKV